VGGRNINQKPNFKSQSITIHPIGHVERDEQDDRLSGDELRARSVRIVLDPSLTDALMGLRPGSHIIVLFYLHRSTGYNLKLHPRGDPSRPLRGLFATRTPRRPNPIALTTARVRHVEDNVLEVIGLDALDGSPVVDIKAYAEVFDTPYTGAGAPNGD
jgi:tRNA-Thr(GGU) m(6)t(6)A37 methyltransferase TsaA